MSPNKDETRSQYVTRISVDGRVFSLVLMYDGENNLGFADDYEQINNNFLFFFAYLFLSNWPKNSLKIKLKVMQLVLELKRQ